MGAFGIIDILKYLQKIGQILGHRGRCKVREYILGSV